MITGKLNIHRCNQFEVTKEQRETIFNIPQEFYLFVDAYYARILFFSNIFILKDALSCFMKFT
jgi:hypothetical protein